MITQGLRRRLTLLCACAALAVPLRAQDGQGSDAPAGGGEGEGGPAEVEQEKNDDRWLAITGGDIHTGTGEVLRGATLLARNGKIRAIGYDLYVPPEAKVLDVKGYRVYPGLVAISSNGLLGNSSSDIGDTIDPFNFRMTLGLATGITTTGIGTSAAKLKRFSIKDAVLAEKIFATFSWSNSNPRQKADLAAKFKSASEYIRKYRDWEKKVKDQKDLPEPSKRGVDNTVLAVLRGEQTAKFVSNDRDELLGIARLAQQYAFSPVIEGCQEGWTVADELGRAGVRAIITPRDRRPKDERQAASGGASIENAAILHKAGVQVVIVPASEGVDLGGLVGRDIMHLPLEPGFAVRGGLPEKAALDSITIASARMLGIGHRVGSLEVGKDCDVIVTDGDVLHYKTFVQWTIVDGKIVYDKEKELFFAHIRPRPEAEKAPRKIDAGETAPKPEDAEKPADAEKQDDSEKKEDPEKKDETPPDEGGEDEPK